MEKKTLITLALALVLLGAVLGAYLPALNAGFVWNDNTYVTENPTLNGLDGLGMIWTEPRSNEQYYPLVFTTYWLEKQLWGIRPFGYHFVNVLFHGSAALLLWAFLRRLNLPGAWLAAAAFALHPVCVESVAWVTERKNTLSLTLSLAAIHLWLSWRQAVEARAAAVEKKKRRPATSLPWYRRPVLLYAAALAAITLALFAKTTASVIPAVLLVLVWWKDGRVRWSDVRPLLPFFAVSVGLAWNTAWLERTMVQASGHEWALGPLGRVVLAGRVVAFYVGKLLFPSGLAFIYPRWTVDPASPAQWIPVALLLAFLGSAYAFRARIGRGPLTVLLLFGGVLFPAMGFFNVYAMRYSYVADHFAYQAVAVGTAGVICSVATWIATSPLAARRAATAVALAGLGVFAVLAFRQGESYRSEETLWQDTLSTNPSCFMCQTNYGYWLFTVGRTDEAVAHFEQSLRIKPDNVPTLLNLARVEEERGRFDDAEGRLRAARAVDPSDPVVHLNLATVLTKSGRPEEAVSEYQDALRFPSASDYLAHSGLGVALMRLGRTRDAIDHFRIAVSLRPDYEHGQANLERALTIAGGGAPPRS